MASTVHVLDQFSVAPPPGSVPASLLPLTFFDVAWLFTGPVERLFFYPYPHSTSHFIAHSLPPLRSSLSLALQRFYPLAGRVRPSTSGVDAQFVYSYSDGDSINFVVAECSDAAAGFEHLVGSAPRDFAKIYPLVPQLPRPDDGSIPLAAVQATVFPGRGVCIGVSIHHVACDDAAAMHFVRSWAAACRLGGFGSPAAPPPPLFDRSVIADPDDLRSKTLAGMRKLAANAPPQPPDAVAAERPPPVIASFLLKREQIDRIKEAVLVDAAAKGTGEPTHSSAFVAACAFAWVCLLKAQGGGEASKRKHSHLLFSVECRPRLAPTVPAEYFGNCLRPCFVRADTADLFKEDGVLSAAAAIGKAIKELEQGVLEGAEGWLKKVVSVLPEGPMSVGGSPRYRVYDTDFGWGRPAKVEMGSIEKTPGTVSLAESPEGDGGIEIGVVLPQAGMDAFSSCFADGLKA